MSLYVQIFFFTFHPQIETLHILLKPFKTPTQNSHSYAHVRWKKKHPLYCGVNELLINDFINTHLIV